jgi:hypothetical protein
LGIWGKTKTKSLRQWVLPFIAHLKHGACGSWKKIWTWKRQWTGCSTYLSKSFMEVGEEVLVFCNFLRDQTNRFLVTRLVFFRLQEARPKKIHHLSL